MEKALRMGAEEVRCGVSVLTKKQESRSLHPVKERVCYTSVPRGLNRYLGDPFLVKCGSVFVGGITTAVVLPRYAASRSVGPRAARPMRTHRTTGLVVARSSPRHL
jgi:hypothetical protein